MRDYRFKIEVIDEETGEEVYKVSSFSFEGLEEDYHKLEHSIKDYEDKMRPDLGELAEDNAHER